MNEKDSNIIRITTKISNTLEFLHVEIENNRGQLRSTAHHKPAAEPHILSYNLDHPGYIYKNCITGALFSRLSTKYETIRTQPNVAIDLHCYLLASPTHWESYEAINLGSIENPHTNSRSIKITIPFQTGPLLKRPEIYQKHGMPVTLVQLWYTKTMNIASRKQLIRRKEISSKMNSWRKSISTNIPRNSQGYVWRQWFFAYVKTQAKIRLESIRYRKSTEDLIHLSWACFFWLPEYFRRRRTQRI